MSGIRRDDGAAAVELAIILPLVVAFIGMILFGGLYGIFSAVANNVARDTASFASTRGGLSPSAPYPSEAEVTAYAAERAPSFMGTPVVTAGLGDRVEGEIVAVEVTFPSMAPLRAAGSFLRVVGVDVDAASTITRAASARRE